MKKLCKIAIFVCFIMIIVLLLLWNIYHAVSVSEPIHTVSPRYPIDATLTQGYFYNGEESTIHILEKVTP